MKGSDGMRPNLLRVAQAVALISALLTSSPSGAQTGEASPVWDLQIQIDIAPAGSGESGCSAAGTGTDDNVRVSLNAANETWLNTGVNDFEPGSTRVYHLLLTGVGTAQDVQYIKIDKDGSDGLCVRFVRLYINHRDVYSWPIGQVGSAPPQPAWLDAGSPRVVWFTTGTHWVEGRTLMLGHLRGSMAWKDIVTGGKLGRGAMQSQAEIAGKIEAAFGHMFQKSAAKWATGYTPVTVFLGDAGVLKNLHAGIVEIVPSVLGSPARRSEPSSDYLQTRGVLVRVEASNKWGSRIVWAFELDVQAKSSSTPAAATLLMHGWYRERKTGPSNVLESGEAQIYSNVSDVAQYVAADLNVSTTTLYTTIRSAFVDTNRYTALFGFVPTTGIGLTNTISGLGCQTGTCLIMRP